MNSGNRQPVVRTVQADLPVEAEKGELWSECGLRIDGRSQAIVHAARCCSVGRVKD